MSGSAGLVAGIDAGSRSVKAVVLDLLTGEVAGRDERDQGIEQSRIAGEALDAALRAAGAGGRDVRRTVATGYGRHAIARADEAVTEITCHARGARHLAPDVRTVVDIGGQDSKVVWLDENGRARDFMMNDRCAAGTGRFLEVVAARMETPVARLGALAAGSTKPAAISSTCVVFAETEITGLLAESVSRADLVAGVIAAIASRVAAMAGGRAVAPVMFTGGVARIPGMPEALGEALGQPVRVLPNPQFAGALGAALMARDGLAAAGGGPAPCPIS